MNRLESLALGLAAGAIAVAFVGAWKIVLGALITAAGSYAWRRFVNPGLGL